MNKLKNEIKKLKEGHKNEFLKMRTKSDLIELIPVVISQKNIKLITKWRKENWGGFLTKFEVTESKTKSWLEKIWNDPERILFLILINQKKIGHIGIFNYNKKNKSVEIDSVLKGRKVCKKILMQKSLEILFNWMFREIKLKKIQLEVFSDNYRAINLYERSGMHTIYSTPLKKVKKLDGWNWERTKIKKDHIAERYLNKMEITKNDYVEQNKMKNQG